MEWTPVISGHVYFDIKVSIKGRHHCKSTGMTSQSHLNLISGLPSIDKDIGKYKYNWYYGVLKINYPFFNIKRIDIGIYKKLKEKLESVCGPWPELERILLFYKYFRLLIYYQSTPVETPMLVTNPCSSSAQETDETSCG